MNIERDLFKRSSVIFDKLEKYGFKKDKDGYTYEKVFFDNGFKAIVTIDKSGVVNGKVIDLQFGEEYLGLRTEMSGSFASKVRNEYINILNDIKDNCFDKKYFIFNQSNRIVKLIKEKYNDDPEFLWDKLEGAGVFRNKSSKKWYGIIMNIDLSKIDDGSGEVEVMNVKLNRNEIQGLLYEKGFYPAYHMNKKDWISIILNDTVKDEIIMMLIEESYNLVR